MFSILPKVNLILPIRNRFLVYSKLFKIKTKLQYSVIKDPVSARKLSTMKSVNGDVAKELTAQEETLDHKINNKSKQNEGENSSDTVTEKRKIFVQTVNPTLGIVDWAVEDEDYDYVQEVARSAYGDMLHDDERNKLYYAGLRDAVARVRARGDSVRVLDIGTGTGLLSMMAVACGADSVIACEAFEPMADCAEKILTANNMGDKVRVIHARSTELTVGGEGSDLPERCNVLVAEVFDTELIGEGAISTYTHARKHLLTPDALLVPSRGRVYAQVVSSPSLHTFSRPYSAVPAPFSHIRLPPSVDECPGTMSLHDIQMSQLPRDSFTPVSEPLTVFEFDWSGRTIPLVNDEIKSFVFKPLANNLGDDSLQKASHVSKDITLESKSKLSGAELSTEKSNEPGQSLVKNNKSRPIDNACHAVLMWWDLTMDQSGDVMLTCAPHWLQPNSTGANSVPWRDHWMQAVYHLPPPLVSPRPNVALQLTAARDEYSLWFRVKEASDCEQNPALPQPHCTCGMHFLIPSRPRIAQLSDAARLSVYSDVIDRHLSKNNHLSKTDDKSDCPLSKTDSHLPKMNQLSNTDDETNSHISKTDDKTDSNMSKTEDDSHETASHASPTVSDPVPLGGWLVLGDCTNLLLLGTLALDPRVPHVYLHETSRHGRRVVAEFLAVNEDLRPRVTVLPEDIKKAAHVWKDVGVVFSEPYCTAAILPWQNLRVNYLLSQLSESAGGDQTLQTIPGVVFRDPTGSDVLSSKECRLLTTTPVFPGRLTLYCLPVCFLNLWKIRAPCGRRCGFDLSIFDKVIDTARTDTDAHTEAQPLWEYPCYALHAPLPLVTLDLRADLSKLHTGHKFSVPLDSSKLASCAQDILLARNSQFGDRDSSVTADAVHYNGVAVWTEWDFGGAEDNKTSIISTGPVAEVVPGQQVSWDRLSQQGVHLPRESVSLLRHSPCNFHYSVRINSLDNIAFTFSVTNSGVA